ncbi:hypothetical protein QJS10_CPA06g00628 [Acorus calamus]|uniref:DUF7910 domain-containing protein n=1 Tax=Acorus calamus TaxID=4465 RepID=A0AAV9ENW4_ACOCL|nr:hypothetical protein QJS10_CPA06g00628 [Acorus calamus]
MGSPKRPLGWNTSPIQVCQANKYIAAENGGGTSIVANRASPSRWETFKGQGSNVVAISSTPGNSETFKIVRKTDDPYRVRIKAPNGLFLQAKTESSVTADFQGSTNWGDNDPSVFVMTIVSTMQGEFQITNGCGQEQAATVMRQHWASFITEEDFRFISSNGLNAVRIPVGWWIASDPAPPWPYVGGSLVALDNAFTWAEYANRPGLLAVELINEPLAPGVTLDSLTKYYSAGYNTVRKYTQSEYVIMSNRLGPVDPKELFSMASGLSRVVIDVHYYNLFTSEFDNMSATKHRLHIQ